MERDYERIERLREALRQAGLVALVCRLPHNVLMLTGYWPVLAESTVIFPAEGEPTLVVPKGEEPLARMGWVEDIRTFQPVSLEKLSNSEAEAEPLLAEVARHVAPSGTHVGFEASLDTMSMPYAEVVAPLPFTQGLYHRVFKGCELEDATDLLRRQREVKTPREIERIRQAHQTVITGIQAAKGLIRPGVRESEVAAASQSAIITQAEGAHECRRVGAFAFCMSGPNGANAYKPFQETSNREIQHGDFVLVHINSFADGFWTDVTRTFVAGEPSKQQRHMYEAVRNGLEAGINAVRSGAKASEVDGVARQVLTQQGYDKEFKHGLGHGVGFKAIYHAEPPILHPKSTSMLKAGMVHNCETGIYTDDLGVRIADVVVVGEHGAEILTDLPRDLAWATCKA